MNTFYHGKKAHIKLGRLGEKSAALLLEFKGMKILERNFRTKPGELDIIALDGGCLVFIEVKTLRRCGIFQPSDNYKLKQIQRNYRAGKEYLRQLGNPEIPHRFDFIEVVRDFRKVKEIRHYYRFI